MPVGKRALAILAILAPGAGIVLHRGAVFTEEENEKKACKTGVQSRTKARAKKRPKNKARQRRKAS